LILFNNVLYVLETHIMAAYGVFAKKTFCHAERSEASIIRHASSPCTVCE